MNPETILFDLIGESAPYVEVYDVTVDNGVVYSSFRPEQQRYAETTLMSCSEGLRTMAVHGVLACAEANPIKSKHYYLATKADIQVSPVHATTSSSFKAVALLYGDRDMLHGGGRALRGHKGGVRWPQRRGVREAQGRRCVTSGCPGSQSAQPVREPRAADMVTAHNDKGMLLSTFQIDAQAHRL
jgi:hypothetical protein